jgi:hypothetical protein
MRKPFLLISAAWLLHIAAWFLPAIKSSTFTAPIRGWEAFRYASCAVWPCQGIDFATWYFAVLSTVSVMTTLLFLLVSPWVVLRGSQSLRRVCAWAAILAFIFNAHWYVLSGSDRSNLMIGYFLWWLSFAALAIGLFVLAGGIRARTAQG